MSKIKPTDPMERILAAAMDEAGIRYATDAGGGSPCNLDFYLPDADLHIEVKQLHSPRIAEQMSRAPNVIAVQGVVAVKWLAKLITEREVFGLAVEAVGQHARGDLADADTSER